MHQILSLLSYKNLFFLTFNVDHLNPVFRRKQPVCVNKKKNACFNQFLSLINLVMVVWFGNLPSCIFGISIIQQSLCQHCLIQFCAYISHFPTANCCEMLYFLRNLSSIIHHLRQDLLVLFPCFIYHFVFSPLTHCHLGPLSLEVRFRVQFIQHIVKQPKQEQFLNQMADLTTSKENSTWLLPFL